MNKLTVLGRLGRDPEMKYTDKGKAYTRFSLAVDVGWGDKKTTMWVNCITWDKQAELINTHLKKGGRLVVEGELAVDPATGGPKTWNGKDGTTKASFELNVREITIIWPDKKEEAAQQPVIEDKQDADENLPF